MRALLCALAALVALGASLPASAAAQGGVEEYDLALPDPTGGGGSPNPDAKPEAEEPAAPVPAAPAATESVAPAPAAEQAAPAPEGPERVEKLDQAAARRDVLFERPESIGSVTSELASPRADDTGLPLALIALIAIGAACIVATMLRLRRAAREAAATARPASSTQAS